MRSQRGFTLIELLLAMAMSLVAAGAGLAMLGLVGQRNLENRRHAERVSSSQIALERMTRELRQANWIRFRSSAVIDADVPVRPGPAAAATRRLVRYDCSQGTSCTRFEGDPTTYPPPPAPVFGSSRPALTDLQPGSVVFVPQAVDPATGEVRTAYVNPTTLSVTARIAVPGWERPVRLDDTVTLRNATSFATPS